MYGTASYEKHAIVSDLGGIPIDYKSVDLVQEIIKVTSHDKSESGADAVFDGIGGKSFKSSYEILRHGGRLVAYGGRPTTDLGDWLTMFTMNVVSDKRKFILYSIQTLKRLKQDWFHEDLILLLNSLEQGKIKPIVAVVYRLYPSIFSGRLSIGYASFENLKMQLFSYFLHRISQVGRAYSWFVPYSPQGARSNNR